MHLHFLTAVLFEALVGTALSVFWGVNGAWISPWLGRIVYPEAPGEYPMTYAVLGMLGGSVLGIAVLGEQRVRGRSLRCGPEMPWPQVLRGGCFAPMALGWPTP
jgi:hypothetical protein